MNKESIAVILLVLIPGFTVTVAFDARPSVLKATDNVPELVSGENILAMGVYQDSPGSSDATLIVKLVADGRTFIDEGSPVRYIEPRRDIPDKKNPLGWIVPGFDDSGWQEGVFGLGYGDGDDKTIVGSKETTLSIYTRAYFDIPDASKIKTLRLSIDYDDSVIVWLNGAEVARSSPTELPGTPHWNDQCGDSNTHEASKQDPPHYESVKLALEDTASTRIDVTLEFLAGSGGMTLEEIAPYRDGLVVNEYRVVQMHKGTCSHRKVRVAHWAVRDGESLDVPDGSAQKLRLNLELLSAHPSVAAFVIKESLSEDYDIPLYLDVTTVEPDAAPRKSAPGEDLTYGCSLTRKMPDFKRLIHQLRFVALGDSRAQANVITDRIYGEVNRSTPVAYNLGVASSGFELSETLVYEYLSHAPRLRWVAFSISPRIFNQNWRGGVITRLKKSEAFRYDKTHTNQVFSRLDSNLVTVGELSGTSDNRRRKSARITLWGWSKAMASGNVGSKPRGNKLRELKRTFGLGRKYQFSEERWRRFRTLVELLGRRGIHFIAFIPPWHPVSANTPAVDDDGTPREAYKRLVDRLEALDSELSYVHFRDFHRAGHHDFRSEEFADAEHLNEAGAKRLTDELEQIRRETMDRGH